MSRSLESTLRTIAPTQLTQRVAVIAARAFLCIVAAVIIFTIVKKVVFSDVDVDVNSLENRIRASGWDEVAKSKALERARCAAGFNTGGEAPKALTWVNQFLRIPVGKFSPPPVPPLPAEPSPEDIVARREAVAARIEEARTILDASVVGHAEAKAQILRVLAQRIRNNDCGGIVIGLKGPPGVGKTTLITKGLAKALGRPSVFISLGNINDGHVLSGEMYSYIGARWGRIIDGLGEAGSMDPVFLFDEADKIGLGLRSNEVSNALIHLTDFSQNSHFKDSYMDLPVDLSRAIFVFSYNDDTLIDPILKDRMLCIDIEALSEEEKCQMVNSHLMPEILKQNGFQPGAVTISEDLVQYIIRQYTHEQGVRGLKAKLNVLVQELGLRDLLQGSDAASGPVEITQKLIDACLPFRRV